MTRRIKIFLRVIGLFFILSLILYLTIFHFGFLEFVVNYRLNQLIADQFPIRIHIDKIEGDYFSELSVKNVQIIYDDGIEEYNVAFIPQLMADYSLRDFINGQLQFTKIFIDSAEISLKKNEAGNWLIPKPNTIPTDVAAGLEFSIKEFGLNNLKFNLIRPTDTITFEDIILAAHLEGRNNTYSIDIDALSYKSSDARLSLKSGGGKATVTGNNLIFQDIFVMTDSSDIQLGGQVLLEKSPQIRVDLNARNMNVREIFSFLGIEIHGNLAARGYVNYDGGSLSGGLTLSGSFMDRQFDSLFTEFEFKDNLLTLDTLSGRIFGGTGIEAVGDIDFKVRPEQYTLIGDIEHFNLNNLIENTFVTDLNGNLVLDGQGLVNKSLLLDFDVNLNESWFDEYHAHKAIGGLTVTADSLRFDRNFEVDYFDNYFWAGGKLEYNGNIDVSGKAEFHDLSAFNDKIFIKEMAGRGRFIGEMSGKLDNPDLSGIFLSDSLWLYQIYSSGARSEFNIKHFLYDRSGHATLSLFDGIAYSIPHDSCWLNMIIDSQFVTIDTARFFNPYTELSCIGNFDYVSYPQQLIIDSINISFFDLPFENEKPAQIIVDSAGFEFRQCGLYREGGFIGWDGRINYDETLDLTIGAKSIDIKPWVKLLTDEYEIGGRLSGRTHLSGSFISPLIEYIGIVDSISLQKLVLGNVFADFHYADENILIDSISLDSYGGNYFAKGNYPINLALVDVDERFPDKEQDIKIKAEDVRFDLISLMLSEVEDMTGDFKSEVELTGTPLKPNLDGWATVDNGTLKLYDLKHPLTDLSISLKMVDQNIFFDKVQAVCDNGKGEKGTIGASGSITINSVDQFAYNIDVTARNFPADYDLGDIKAIVDANLSVRGLTPSTVYGDVSVIKTDYRENFAEYDEGWVLLEALEGENSWDLNLNADIPSNFWIKNDDIDAEFSGTINFIRESGNYRFIGSLDVLRGKGYLAGRTFQIEPGGVITYDDIEYPNPRLDITATTKIRGAVSTIGDESTTESVDLRIRITGTLDEPIIEAAEGSRLSTEQIMSILVTNYYQDENGITPPSWFGDRLRSAAADYISTQMTQIGSRTLGVETFEIDPDYGDKYDPLGTRVTVGFYTHPNLYIYGRSSISGTTGQQLGFEYRIQRFMLLEGRADENDLYQLFLNFYWEY